jgi:hypothetical protein
MQKELWFNLASTPAPNCFGSCPNPQGIYSSGSCPPSHPNAMAPLCAPPSTGGPTPPPPSTGGPTPPPPSTGGPTPPPPSKGGPTPPPTGVSSNFQANMISGYNQFGCSFLNNRKNILRNKLNQLQSAGTNPLWQQKLSSKLAFITQYSLENCGGSGQSAISNPNYANASGTSGLNSYGSIFSEKNYWIGVVAGLVGLMAYQKYIK